MGGPRLVVRRRGLGALVQRQLRRPDRAAGRARGRSGAWSSATPALVVLPRRLHGGDQRRRHGAGARAHRARRARTCSGSPAPARSAAEPWTGSVALEDPARYAATVFARGAGGARHRGRGPVAHVAAPLPAGTRVLAAHESAPLARDPEGGQQAEPEPARGDAAAPAGRARAAASAASSAGHEAVARVPEAAGRATRGWSLQDGSGLSRSDLVTPHEHGQPAGGDGPPSARGGVPRRRCPSPAWTARSRTACAAPPPRAGVLAKTGTLRHVNALAGYVTTRGGEPPRLRDRGQPPHARAARRRPRAIDAIGALLAAQP